MTAVVLQAPPFVPIINMNGTSRKALIEQRTEACATVRAAIKALCEMRPNGRDFQNADVGAYENARQGHELRIAALQAVHDDLMKEAEYLYVTGLDSKRHN
jgi:hypothetical protein